MTPCLLYIRGEPGAGKITVARELEKSLGWKPVWLHDLDVVCRIVGEHPVPRLMEQVTEPIVRHLLARQKNVIFVRPSRDALTVNRMRHVASDEGARFVVVCLTASRETRLERVTSREASEFRIHDAAGLNEYQSARPEQPIDGEYRIATDEMCLAEVCLRIKGILGYEGVLQMGACREGAWKP